MNRGWAFIRSDNPDLVRGCRRGRAKKHRHPLVEVFDVDRDY